MKDLADWVKISDWPRVACPECRVGTVGPTLPLQSLLDAESKEVLDQARQGGWASGELSGTFVGVLKCDHTKCRQELAAAGEYAYTYDFDDFEGYNPPLVDMYRLQYLRPAPLLIDVPPKTPGRVKNEIAGAAELLFLNPGASGNRLRRAVEELMNAHRIRKTVTDRRGRTTRATLHSRIDAFSAKHPFEAEVLLAVKWIGNEATHGRDLTIADVLTCAEVLEAALKGLYDRTDAELRMLVRKINRQRGLKSAR